MAPPTQCLPRSVCGVISLETGLQILVGIAIILRLVIITILLTTGKIINLQKIRLAGTICGCFYGPYIYLALPIGGIYLAGSDHETMRGLGG